MKDFISKDKPGLGAEIQWRAMLHFSLVPRRFLCEQALWVLRTCGKLMVGAGQ